MKHPYFYKVMPMHVVTLTNHKSLIWHIGKYLNKAYTQLKSERFGLYKGHHHTVPLNSEHCALIRWFYVTN